MEVSYRLHHACFTKVKTIVFTSCVLLFICIKNINEYYNYCFHVMSTINCSENILEKILTQDIDSAT